MTPTTTTSPPESTGRSAAGAIVIGSVDQRQRAMTTPAHEIEPLPANTENRQPDLPLARS